jgi:hypothetical protein
MAERVAELRVTQNRTFCAEYSRAAGEEMAGTVKPSDLWLLIEYRGRWEREVITGLPEILRERISRLRSRVPGMRMALIKQTDRNSGPLSAFWAFSSELGPRLFRTDFDTYQELSLDFEQLQGEAAQTMFAVCTHGTHDLCCAQFGNKIYSEMSASSEDVWQVSHIGGCRFAPNVVCLPHGVVYGRVERVDCAAIVSTYNQGLLLLPKLRGRSCYAKPAQAAEQFLRTAKHLAALQDLRLTGQEEIEPGRWSMTFLTRDSVQHQVSVAREENHRNTFKSCSAMELSPRERLWVSTFA